MITTARHDVDVVLTGATGFLGHYILAEGLSLGWRCAVLLRPPLDNALSRLHALLAEIGVDSEERIASGSLIPVLGDINGHLPAIEVAPTTVLIHSAATTNFERNAHGDPWRTNAEGTRKLIEWADGIGIRRVHLVSSAYSCGRTTGDVPELFNPDPPEFHNEYERSKWESERLCVEWGRARDAGVTIHRPSIIVGAFETGRATKFGGIYISARATELLERMHRDSTAAERQAIPLRIVGRALDRQNIVPVDYVARMITAAVRCEEPAGRVYNLVHPNPPSNLQIKQAFEQYFGIAGGRFVPPERFPSDGLNDYERSFRDVSKPIEHYFIDSPNFRRENTAALEADAGIECPRCDADSIARMIRYAQSVSWGRKAAARASGAPGCAAYFESFLPRQVAKSSVARMTAVTATIRFVIEDEPNGQWVCRFERGRVESVHRGENGYHEDFGYRTSRDAFWESVSGRFHPQELFLSGRAEMFGDVAAALKMSMIMHSFTREFPCDPPTLARFITKERPAN